MREIEFRGRAEEDGEWMYGDLIHGVETRIRICDGGDIPVKPATVGQFTGLRDKNGNKIYEGDIIIESECLPGDNIPRVVEWERGSFRCSYIKKHWAAGDNNVPFQFLYDLKNGGIEVIGNIHDNPELIKQ